MGLKQIALPMTLPGTCAVLPITPERKDGHYWLPTYDETQLFCTGCGARRSKG